MISTKLIIKSNLIFLILVLIALQVFSTINYDDGWTYSFSTASDGVVWGSYYLDTYASSYSTYADCLCWDWCDDGSADNTIAIWDTCWCKSSTVKSHCETYSSVVNNVCNVKNDCAISSNLG